MENLVSSDHLLRKLDRYLEFDFIRDQAESLYCENNGRPAVDPVLMFKVLFIGYLFGVGSERQLVREAQVNVAYRWFWAWAYPTKSSMPRSLAKIDEGGF